MSTRYVSKCVALSVEERHTEVWSDEANAKVKKSLGWFVRVSESSAIGVGPEKPNFKEGDKLKLSLELDQ